jgi:HSP20 family protein
MEVVRWDQVEGVNRIQSRINELFEDTFGRPRAQQSAAAGVWYPAVDILESKDSYLIRAELPGMRKEDLKTEVNEGILTLSGERKFEEPANGVEYTGSSGLPVSFLDPSTCHKP